MPAPRGKTFRSKATALWVCAAALTVALTGCPKPPKPLPGSPKASKIEVQVYVAPNANRGRPVALDLVLVRDKELLKKLKEMSAAEWFEQREQIMLDTPKEGALVVGQWEWVPGQVIKAHVERVEPEVRAAVVFANYSNPGEHRAVLDPRRNIQLRLGESKLVVTQVKK